MTPGHSDGLLDLRFARAEPSGRTYVRERRQRFPLRITVPLYLDPAEPALAYVYVQNPTGGVFAGDRLVTRVTAEPGTRVHVTTQSATKVYRMEGGEARQDLTVRAGDGAYVEYLPDQLIPQAGSVLHQRTHVDVAHGARYLAGEVLAPGRVARGERFAYDRLTTRIEVTRGAATLCVDTVDLAPRRRSPRTAGALGDGDYLATLVVVAPEDDADALTERLDTMLARDTSVAAAAGTLPNGAGTYARIVATTATAARTALARVVSAARVATLGHPLPTVRK